MKNSHTLLRFVVLLLTLVITLSGCSGGGSSTASDPATAPTTAPTSPTLVSISVTPANPKIAKGTCQQFMAVGGYSDNTNQNITGSVVWSSSDSSKVSVDNFGRAEAIAAGTTTVTAVVGSISGSGALTVTNATLISLVVTPANPSVAKGTSQQFTAMGIFSDNTLQDLTNQVTWSSSDSSKATVSSNGIAMGASAGETTITATSGSITATATLTVTNATLVTLAVTPVNPSVVAGATQQFTAMGGFSDGTSQDLSTQVAWASSDISKATINTNGLATSVAAGTSTITAKSGNTSATAGLTVTPAPTNSPPAGSVQLTGNVAPDPSDSTATGKQSGATVYAMGQQNNSVTTDSNGNYTLYVNPQLSGSVLTSPRLKTRLQSPAIRKVAAGTATITYYIVVVDSNDSHGRMVPVQIVTNQTNTASTIYINQVGTISGHAYLQGATDNSGITVYIPGTSFSAITAADGSYTISGVPSGTYNFLRAEKFGTVYHYAILSDITVNSNQDTVVADMLLQATTGAFGSVLINNGALFTNSNTVGLALAPSSDAVLMSVSDNSSFVGAAWESVQASKQFTFTGDYSSNGGAQANIYVKFAQESGLASEPVTTTIWVDSNPQATKLAPASVTMSTSPTLQWQYTPPMPNPLYYVQLTTAADISFSTPIVDQSDLSSTQYTVPTMLSQGGYIWRVAIIYNGTQLSWGPTWSFTIDRTAGTLSQPINITTNNTTPTFTWLANPSALSYDFVLALNSNLTNTVKTQSGISGSTYGPISALSGTTSAIYYWAITPRDSLGNPGTQSGIGHFALDTVAPVGGGVPVSAPTGTGITINNNDIFAAKTVVTLNLAATDANKVTAYLVSQSPATPSLNDSRWVAVIPTSSLSTNATFTLSSASGLKTVYSWFKDAVGNTSSAYSDSINLIDFSSHIQTVDDGGLYGSPSIAYNPNSGVNISYSDQLNYGAKFTTNYGGSWAWPIYLDNATTAYAGSEHSIATHINGSQYDLHVVYMHDLARVTYEYKPGILRSPWLIPITIDTVWGNSNSPVPAIAVDSNNKAHMAYIENDRLKYANIDPAVGISSLATFSLDSSGTGTIFSSISIVVDSNNFVYIGYYDQYNDVLKVITNATGSWLPTVIDSGIGGTASFKTVNPSMAVSNNMVHIAYYDTTNQLVKYATSASGWVPSAIGPPGQLYFGFVPLSMTADVCTNDAFVVFTTSGGLTLATNKFGQWASAVVDSNAPFAYTSVTSYASGSCMGKTINIAYVDNFHGYVLKYTYGSY